MKSLEEDRTVEKFLDLPARSPVLRDEGRAEPLMDLTRTLKNPSKTSIFSKYVKLPLTCQMTAFLKLSKSGLSSSAHFTELGMLPYFLSIVRFHPTRLKSD